MKLPSWWKQTVKIPRLIALLVLCLIFLNFPHNVSAQTLFFDEFNGTGELHNYNNTYQKLLNFNNGSFTLFTNHVRAIGFDPAYVYTGILGNNVCASIDFNWGGVARWTGIMLRSTPSAAGTGWQDMFSITQRDGNRWILYVNAQEAATGPVVINLNQTHTLKVCISGTTITGYIDGVLLGVGQDSTNTGGYVGFSSQIGTNFLDNFKIESNSIGLNVPELKQTQSPWNVATYDSADEWFPSDPSIGAWGCALTSAAMVFQYHGLNKFADGITPLNPATLNIWLDGQADGYVGSGLVNWLALTRFSKQAKVGNPQFLPNALEFSRINGADTTQLTQDLQNGIPGILEEPGHFVVAKGTDSATFKINDPFYDRSDLVPYGNTFLSLSRFVPSNTDLSYIMAVVNPSVTLSLKNSSNQAVGYDYIQQPLTHDATNAVGGTPVKILYFQQPTGGDYSLDLSSSSNENYQFKLYLYDKDGNVKIASGSGIVGSNDTDKYLIQFNKDNSNNSISKQNVTFESFIADIKSLYATGDLSFQIYMPILTQAKVSWGLSMHGVTKKGAVQILKIIDKEILNKTGKGVSNNAYNILHADIQSLLLTL